VSSEHFPNWQGNLLSGGLASQQIKRLAVENTDVSEEETLLKETIGRVRDVRQGPDGYIYVLVDASKASMYRLEPAR
jgi:glucose/arabinose dehydrogenase